MPNPASVPGDSVKPGKRVALASCLPPAAGIAMAEFLAQLGLTAVTLDDGAGGGAASFLDRAGDLAGFDYAVVMLTDEVLQVAAGQADASGRIGAMLLKVGYLMGVVGPARATFVVAGHSAPAWAGTVRLPLDEAGVWRLLLAREMKRAGLDVDLNRAL